jgi:hypothetical protein
VPGRRRRALSGAPEGPSPRSSKACAWTSGEMTTAGPGASSAASSSKWAHSSPQRRAPVMGDRGQSRSVGVLVLLGAFAPNDRQSKPMWLTCPQAGAAPFPQDGSRSPTACSPLWPMPAPANGGLRRSMLTPYYVDATEGQDEAGLSADVRRAAAPSTPGGLLPEAGSSSGRRRSGRQGATPPVGLPACGSSIPPPQ